MPTTNGLSMTNIFEKGIEKSSKLEQETQALFESSDSSDLGDMLKLQQQLGKVTMTYSLNSSVIKSLKDTIMGIIQKIA